MYYDDYMSAKDEYKSVQQQTQQHNMQHGMLDNQNQGPSPMALIAEPLMAPASFSTQHYHRSPSPKFPSSMMHHPHHLTPPAPSIIHPQPQSGELEESEVDEEESDLNADHSKKKKKTKHRKEKRSKEKRSKDRHHGNSDIEVTH